MRVTVHKNLTKGTWSVCEAKQTRNGERKGRKLMDLEQLTLEDAHFYVGSESTRQRILAGHREVYAYAVGTLCVHDDGEPWDADPANITCGVHFNPYRSNDFEDEDGNPITDNTYFRMYFHAEANSHGEVTAL